MVGGRRLNSTNQTTSRNPANLTQIIGRICDATTDHVDLAVEAATEAARTWATVPVEVRRTRYLIKAAAILRRQIYEFSAWMAYEASKSWPEAYADAAEAVDFLEFYAREALRWGAPHPTVPFAGEEENGPPLSPPRRGRRHRAVELPAGHSHRNDGGGHRHGKHRRPQTRGADADPRS